MYDGFYAVVTNLDDDVQDIIAINKRRWQIEECFRILKSDFDARPVYLRDDDRIKAHFLICFMALLFFRILENKLEYKYTADKNCGHHEKDESYIIRRIWIHPILYKNRYYR